MRNEYQRLQDEGEDNSSIQLEDVSEMEMTTSSPQGATTPTAQEPTASVPIVSKEESSTPPKYEEVEVPPSYLASLRDPEHPDGSGLSPSLIVANVSVSDMLVEGIQVGSWTSFWMVSIFSFLFGIIGVLFALIFAASHAAMNGARFGLGMIIFYQALYLPSAFMMYGSDSFDDSMTADNSLVDEVLEENAAFNMRAVENPPKEDGSFMGGLNNSTTSETGVGADHYQDDYYSEFAISQWFITFLVVLSYFIGVFLMAISFRTYARVVQEASASLTSMVAVAAVTV